MSDIFSEVDENLRSERSARIWDVVKWPLLIGIIAVISTQAYFEFSKMQRASTLEKGALHMEQAAQHFEDDQYDLARQEYTLAAQQTPGLKALAAHHLADIELKTGGGPEAAKQMLLGSVEEDQILGALAILKVGYMTMDDSSIEELETLLAPVIAQGGAFKAMGTEIIAAKAFALEDYQRSRNAYDSIRLDPAMIISTAPDLPPGVLRRTDQALAVLTAMGVESEPSFEAGFSQSEPTASDGAEDQPIDVDINSESDTPSEDIPLDGEAP